MKIKRKQHTHHMHQLHQHLFGDLLTQPSACLVFLSAPNHRDRRAAPARARRPRGRNAGDAPDRIHWTVPRRGSGTPVAGELRARRVSGWCGSDTRSDQLRSPPFFLLNQPKPSVLGRTGAGFPGRVAPVKNIEKRLGDPVVFLSERGEPVEQRLRG